MAEKIIRLGAVCAFLWRMAVPDIRTKRIPVRAMGFFAAAVLTAGVIRPSDADGYPLWLGIIPGTAVLLLSFALRGKVGEGDGICIMACGMCAGIGEILPILVYALWMCAAAGALGMVIRGREGDAPDRKIAFIPFLAAAASIRLIGALAGRG